MFMFPLKIVHRTTQREKNCRNWSDLFFVEILASKVVAQVISQKFVLFKVSVVYSLKLLHSGEFPRHAKCLDDISFHYNVYFFIFFSFCLSTKTKCGSC